MVVEDDGDIRESMQSVLETEGYHVSTASNGREALDRLKAARQAPALILLDLMMPIMDGWEFLKEREKEKTIQKIPVVVVSALSNGVVRNDHSTVGFLRKPIELESLLNL